MYLEDLEDILNQLIWGPVWDLQLYSSSLQHDMSSELRWESGKVYERILKRIGLKWGLRCTFPKITPFRGVFYSSSILFYHTRKMCFPPFLSVPKGNNLEISWDANGMSLVTSPFHSLFRDNRNLQASRYSKRVRKLRRILYGKKSIFPNIYHSFYLLLNLESSFHIWSLSDTDRQRLSSWDELLNIVSAKFPPPAYSSIKRPAW